MPFFLTQGYEAKYPSNPNADLQFHSGNSLPAPTYVPQSLPSASPTLLGRTGKMLGKLLDSHPLSEPKIEKLNQVDLLQKWGLALLLCVTL
jgi:hypothetical protein